MILVTGPTGNTGSVAVNALLGSKKTVRAIVRSADKADKLRARGVDVIVGSVADPATFARALAGVKSVYFLVPPDPQATDLVAQGRRVVDNFVAALQGSSVEHVVFLSSIGAQHEAGNGPVKILNYGERAIRGTGKKLTALRAGYFMENTASMVGLMKAQGILPCIFDPSTKIPMVASADIGAVAARALVEPPAASEIIELEGPVPLSYQDVATAFSTALGKPVNAIAVPGAGVVPALTQAGLSENVASLYKEMGEGIEKGLLAFQGGSARHVRAAIAIAEVAKRFAAV